MRGGHKPWTLAEENRLCELYDTHSQREIAAMLGRTEAAISSRVAYLGIGKPDGYRNPGQFRAGEKPWNTGISYTAGGRSAQTRFKPGQTPINAAPIGAYRLTKDGTLQRKISNAAGNNSKRWRGVHELVWIAANGELPPGHIVVFRPGMRTAELDEITLDKVECISLAENMRRNSVHNLPKPVAQLVQLRGALVRKINSSTKGEARP